MTQSDAARAYRPRGAAKALFPCRDAEVLIEGPAGTGKSRSVLEKLLRWLLKCPGSRALIVRKTRASLTQSVLVTLEEKVIPDNPELYPDLRAQQRRNRQSYVFPNGSELVIGGMDDPNRIMSTEYDMIAAFEATELTEADWESLLSRLRNGVMPYQQAIADCNPSAPSHWLNKRADKPYEVPAELVDYMPAPRPGQKQMTRLLSRHEDNPMMFDIKSERWTARGAQYLSTLNRLTGARKTRLLSGKWAAQEGLVYEGFDPAIHLIDFKDLPLIRRNVAGVDWGFTHPGIIQVWGIDNDGRMYLRREIVRTKQDINFWIQSAKSVHEEFGIETFVCDPAEPSYIQQFQKAGLPAQAGFNDIEPGVDAVRQRIDAAEDKKPRLFACRDALQESDANMEAEKLPIGLLAEFDAYSYPKAKDGKVVKDKPLDLYNHSCDAARYAVAYVDRLDGNLDLDFSNLSASFG